MAPNRVSKPPSGRPPVDDHSTEAGHDQPRPRRHSVARTTGGLFALATLAVAAVVTMTTYSSAWNQPDWSSEATKERVQQPSSSALPTLFAADRRSRRAGVKSWMRQIRGETAPLTAAATLPVPYHPDQRARYDSVTTFDGVNYADVTGSGIPLQWLGDDADDWLSPGLRLRDFVSHDGAPFVRIDPDLVARLERLRTRTGELRVVSGYRHPAYNLTVGGEYNSLHTAGRAADVWSPNHTSLELARLALLEMGCDIGIGLNQNTIHVDVRGELASWTYEGAPMTEPAFDAWTLVQCGRPVPAGLSQAAASAWLDEPGDLLELSDIGRQPTPTRLQSARPTVEGLLAEHAAAIAATYRRGAAVEPGGVILDLQDGPPPHIRYVAASSAEAEALGLPALISWCSNRGGAYVAYAVVQPDTTIVGVSNELGIGGHAPNHAAPVPHMIRETPATRTPSDTSNVSGSPGMQPSAAAARPGSARPRDEPPADRGSTIDTDGWVVFAGSYEEASEAETQASHLEELLTARVFVVAAADVGRYRIAVGPYPSSSDAAQARERFGDAVPDDAWIAPL